MAAQLFEIVKDRCGLRDGAERVIRAGRISVDSGGDFNKTGKCSKKLVGARRQEPIDPSVCKAIKDRGIRIAVFYTTCLPLPTNDWYEEYVSPFQPQIGKNMEACASPGLFFEVSPTEGIAQAMEALFKKVVSKAYLTG